MVMGDDGILRPGIIKPDILGKGPVITPPKVGEGDGTSGSGSSLSTFDTTDDKQEDPDSAAVRENLSAMLGLLGFPDLPATRSDLIAVSSKMVKLQQQMTQAIKDLQSSGADPAGLDPSLGGTQGPPDPSVKTKIDALNDLQLQLKESASLLKDYAYQYFSSEALKEKKVLPLSQAQTLRAYEDGLIGGDLASKKLSELGMSEEDIGILIKGANKDIAEKRAKEKGGGLDADTIIEGYSTGVLTANETVLKLKQKGFTEQDIRLVLNIIDAKARKAAEKASSKGSGSGSGSGSGGSSSSRTSTNGAPKVNVNVSVDTAALAREALARAKARR